MASNPCIVVHGGIIKRPAQDPMPAEKVSSCCKAASIGYNRLSQGYSSVEAVEAALRWLEDDEIFKCGYGSPLKRLGEVKMDATIADGATLSYGSVWTVSKIDHPISLAKHVMENQPNTIFCEERATDMIGISIYRASCFEIAVLAEESMLPPTARTVSLRDSELEVEGDVAEAVGCVARDTRGNLAAGSSSGGEPRGGAFADRCRCCSLSLAPGHRGAAALARRLGTSSSCSPRCALAGGAIAATLDLNGPGWAACYGADCCAPYCCMDAESRRAGLLLAGQDITENWREESHRRC